jgi:hypothetical protein
MSAADAENAKVRLEQLGVTIVRIAGAAGAVVMAFVSVFVVALVVKLLARWVLRAPIEYMKAVEMAGLASMILVLAGVVQALLVVVFGNILSTPGPVLLVGEIDAKNKFHMALASINLMTLWYLGVLGLGLARLTTSSFWRAGTPLFGLWALMRTAVILLGWGNGGL